MARPGDVLALDGPLGVGKTFFAAAFCAALGVDRSAVDSPSFVLLNEYEGRWGDEPLPLFHFDAYRLQPDKELLAEAGWLDERLAEGVCVVEWAERLGRWLPATALRLRLESTGPTSRRLELYGWPPARLAALTPWREAPA